jgi:hypothetical protein
LGTIPVTVRENTVVIMLAYAKSLVRSLWSGPLSPNMTAAKNTSLMVHSFGAKPRVTCRFTLTIKEEKRHPNRVTQVSHNRLLIPCPCSTEWRGADQPPNTKESEPTSHAAQGDTKESEPTSHAAQGDSEHAWYGPPAPYF